MSGLVHRLGLWSTSTSELQGHLHAVQSLGFEYVVVRVVYHPNGPAEPYQPDVLKQLVADGATIGLSVYAWAYCYPKDVDQQVKAIAKSLPDPCANLVLDIEGEWEDHDGADASAHQLFHGIAEAIGHRADLHLSSFYNPDRHGLPYAACLAHCQSFMPQSYRVLPTSVETVISRTLAQDPPLAKRSLGRLLVPTVNRPDMLSAVAGHMDVFAGANVWLWDGDEEDMGVRGFEDQWRPAIQEYKAAVSQT